MKNFSELRPIKQDISLQNSVRKVFPSLVNKLFAEYDHDADMRRQNKLFSEQMAVLLDKATAEKRPLSDHEAAAWDWLTASVDINETQIELNNYALRQSGSANDENRIFAKGQKAALNHKPQDLEGLNLGKIMRAMAIGSRGNQQIQNALSEGTNSAGGYTVPVELLREFVDLARDKSVLMQAGARTVLLESNKSSMAAMQNDPDAGWRAENAIVVESAATFLTVAFSPKSLAVLVKASRELLEDSLNIEEMLLNSLAQSLALKLDYAGLYGTGSANEPLGLKSILTTANRKSTLGSNGVKLSAAGQKWSPIVSAMQKVSAANDMATSAIMNSRTLYDLNGLTATDGQPLQPPAIAAGLQLLDTNSVPINLSEGSATTASEIFTGNFENLLLGLRSELRIEILKEAFADHLQVGFLCHLRADWACARSGAFWLTQGVLGEA